MMLHEAVMLEIYRQALTASELTSPRCQSRESNISAAAIDGRCPSNGSHCSGNERSATPATTTSHPNTPPAAAAGLPLTATLAPAAAAALLPPQSAAMAAYFNAAAAAAAQQNHLLLTNPLAAAASLVQQHATRAPQSPTTAQRVGATTTTSPNAQQAREMTADEPVLDFSTKPRRQSIEGESDDDDADDIEEDEKMVEDNEELANAAAATGTDVNSPLDLSCGRKRESCVGDEEEKRAMPARKTLRTTMHHHNNNNNTSNYNTLSPGNWMPAINPYLAAVAAASLSPPKSPLSPLEWSGKHKLLPNEATKALEKMTEMTRLGSATDSAELPQHRHANSSNSGYSNGSTTHTGAGSGGGGGGGGGARHSAWQSHWLNKGADAVRDVFKCVWCKQSFPTLATLTVHMKETQHCVVSSSMPPIGATNNQTSTHGGVGVSGGFGGGIGGGVGGGLGSNLTTQSATHHLRHTSNGGGGTPNHNNLSHPGTPANASSHTSSPSASPATSKSDLNLLIKETMPLPRKLVRGQDVWLGKGAEQTREILKCMWCGQSFRSLAEMTAHMQETQHYTNIISQEQIISWKSTDDKNSTGGGGGSTSGVGGGNSGVGGAGSSTHSTTGPLSSTSPAVTTPPSMVSSSLLSSPNNNNNMHNNFNNNNSNSAPPSTTATVAAVLTCKVCDSAFPTLKELSQHMMKYSHYQEQMMRALASAGGSSSGGCGSGHGGENTPSAAAAAARRGRQMREKRKKSLPVRKLLEMERNAQQDYKNSMDPALKPLRDFAISTKITCETCGEKVETALFVEHIRRCLSGSLFEPKHKQRAQHNQGGGGGGSSIGGSSSDFSVGVGEPLRPTFASMSSYEPLSSPQTPTSRSDGRKTSDSNISHVSQTTPRTAESSFYALPKETAEKTSNSSTPSVLNALEQLIEKSFDTRARNCNSAYSSQAGGNGGSQRSTPLGSSILRRLGIDDSVDYTKPLLDPQTMHFMRSSYSGYSARDRSASESSSISERCNSRIEAFTPERMERGRYAPSTPRLTPDEEKSGAPEMHETNAAASTDQLPNSELLHIKAEPLDGAEEPQELREVNEHKSTTHDESPQKISVKKEFNMFDNQEEEERHSNDSAHYKSQTQALSPRATSPTASERSITPKSTTSSERAAAAQVTATTPTPFPTPIPTTTATAPNGSSLNALSSMFENLNNMSTSAGSSAAAAAAAQLHAAENLTTGIETNNNNTNKKSNANPLAALQKLCETTDKSTTTTTVKSTTRRNSSTTTTNGLHHPNNHHNTHHNTQLAGNMMAFSWACNDAVQKQQQQQQTNAAESLIKCSQCDAVFSSKGSYRHHFSKVHFVKDEIEVKSPKLASSPKSAATSPKSNASKSPMGAGASASASTGGMAAPIINPYNESSQSKFLKYTELAKQLSSKNA